MRRIAAAEGVRDVRINARTGNVLIEFDQALIDELRLLTVLAGELACARARAARPAPPAGEAPDPGWLRASRSETIEARPPECVSTLLEFERYPEWQSYVDSVTVLERDKRGRGARVATHGRVGEREFQFIASYRYPSPNRVAFAQIDGELDAVRGGWAFRSLGGGRSRATYRLEVKLGWRLGLVLRGPVYEQIREAVLDQVLSELRARVVSRGDRGARDALCPISKRIYTRSL